MRLTVLLAYTLLGCSCSGGNVASELAKAPGFNPKGQSKCMVKKSQSKPLIVEWPSAERVDLEASRRHGPVVVRYDGCEMQLLTRCRAPGSYQFEAVTPKHETLVIRNKDELYAKIPIGAARFEGKLAKSGQLNVAMTMVGRFTVRDAHIRRDQLQGGRSCNGATHILASLTVGAFEFYAGADATVGASAHVVGLGAGAKSVAKRETLTKDGDPGACQGGPSDGPPPGCSALLRVEVVVLGAQSCPAGTRPEGNGCVAEVSTDCAAGLHFVEGTGCVPDHAPASATAVTVPKGAVLVPAGNFWMGCAPSDRQCTAKEKPGHRVYLDAFHIDKTEVMVSAYQSCVNAGHCTTDHLSEYWANGKYTASKYCHFGKSGRGNHPMNCVSYGQAEAFCKWKKQRLPTEAEWEKAARGTDKRIYPWGKTEVSCKYAVMNETRLMGQDGCGRGSDWPVGSKPAGASPYGALDMIGNVSEWVSDWYSETYYKVSPDRNPTGPSSGGYRISRGGDSGDVNTDVLLRASSRWLVYKDPEERSPTRGFRCVRPVR